MTAAGTPPAVPPKHPHPAPPAGIDRDTSRPPEEPPPDVADVAMDPHAGRAAATPPHLTRRRAGIAALLTVQGVIVLGALAVVGRLPTPGLLAACSIPTALLASVPLRGGSLIGRIAQWAAWRRRQRRAAHVSRQQSAGNPLWVLAPRLRLGSIKGPWNSEIGVFHCGGGWSVALWVTSADRQSASPDDALGRILALPAPASDALTLRAVLQQSTPDATPDVAVPAVVTAWLVLTGDPRCALPADRAVGAVPALMRHEIRALLQQTSERSLRAVALDRNDLVGALAASTEIPLHKAPPGEQTVVETWQAWNARGRWHQSFTIRPSAEGVPGAVASILDAAADFPGTTTTLCVPCRADHDLKNVAITVRVSHRTQTTTEDAVARLRSVLALDDVPRRGLGGRQGPALLETSVLAGHGNL